ncbi:MAG: killer suppression protein [Verrucomicrobia bacterium]|nr:MAG: killer suppression protein [Verrucomicrobiota bacterium]TAE85411.1 MAG: killer suppression protein [Verrucomicrobiota bacterium]TAF26577.1 MAG: killer suppression protein [Verrucomicrobiota bacterium]
MDVSFRNKKLEKLANDTKEQQRQLGTNSAKKFKRRLDDLRAARNLAEMFFLPGRLHPHTGDNAGVLSLDIEHPMRLLMVPAHDPIPRKSDGGLDWDAITAVEITEITDPHD